MTVSLAKKVILILLTLSLFSCGELETLLPSNGSYPVKTLVNGNSLEDCSIIRSDDEIRPYFAVSVKDDPDLVGLLMYLQDSQGEIIGEKVRYILDAYADDPTEEETTAQKEAEPQTDTDGEAPNEPGEIEVTEKTETAEEAIENKPQEASEVKTRRSFTNTKIKESSIAIEIAVSSLADELPYFPLPENAEPNSYTLVFEALGKKEVLSRMETSIFYLGSAEFNLKDFFVYLPGLSSDSQISPETTVLLETQLDFDSRLDPYVIWYSGKNIIGEGRLRDGAGNILWKAPPQAGFYPLRLEVFPRQFVKRNFAGVSREKILTVSPKAVNWGYFFENTPGYASRSHLTEGTIYPEQIKLLAEMPLTEDSVNDGDGKTIPPVPPSPPKLLRWYQFDGSLHDSTAPLDDEQVLLSTSEKESPRWVSVWQNYGLSKSYGLSTEANNAYQLSSINFFRKEQDQGGGIFLFHIKPSSTESSTGGVIFSAFFPMLASDTDGAWINMTKEKSTIVLRLNAGGTIAEIPVYVDPLEAQSLIPIVVEFYISPYLLEAKISLGENMQSNAGKINLSGALKGEGRIRLGGENNRPASGTAQTSVIFKSTDSVESSSAEGSLEEDSPAEETNADIIDLQSQAAYQTNTIWDEFAILFSSIPLLQEEFLVEDIIESGETKTENNAPEADQNKTEQKLTTPLTDNDTETVGGGEPISPEADIKSTEERETVAIIPEND